jgi:dienelactone hydrolase
MNPHRPLIIFLCSVLLPCAAADSVEQSTLHFPTNGPVMDVNAYLPVSVKQAPLVVVVHGFSRNKNHMRGWGDKLAAEGFVVLIPTLPHLADHRKNANAIVKLVAAARAGTLAPDFPKITAVGLVGFSMGGLVTLLSASALEPPIDAWAGLDPADFGGLGAAASSRVNAPGLLFKAARDPFNLEKSRAAMVENYGGHLEEFGVSDSTHGDVESHPDFLVELSFGKTSPQRHAEILLRTLEFLKEHLNH